MRIASFSHRGVPSFGVVRAGGIVDLGARFAKRWPSVRCLLPRQERDAAEGLAAALSPDVALDDIDYLPPVPDAGRIICVGLNFRSHAAELGLSPPAFPPLVSRFGDSLVGHGQALVRPAGRTDLDFEGELVIVIGDGGRRIEPTRALDHVAGYMPFNDGVMRDEERASSQFLRSTCYWRSGAAGPWLVTPDEAGPVEAMTLTTRLNGNIMQAASLGDLIFDIGSLVSTLSNIFPLQPGDIISTGTPSGVGVGQSPPYFLKAGDVIEVELTGLGTLHNRVEDEA